MVAVAFAPVWLALGVGNLGNDEPVFGWIQVALGVAWAVLGVHEWRRWRAVARSSSGSRGGGELG
ncbi:hypothetical protein JD78_00498 [Modestobacter roseus]|uniref:Uncharacterized protein n=1 Tax=Modestobacter roseus TaxID=1181884 RepID=A0A562IMP4_9ACTN|nr:hypothetical protein JD78_00498 [Modestobacter roseus]